ncbi:mitochondrial elongation factor G like protein [Spathaspora passalidarum NRRL Y-27907]|uniref:Ribosome-releasing factor 2, mitochondrial n=1 Tax=Spathaspora passalidarum (strain NRRL Y-27907 / 11-Y1) TaxID=619300 RepID=G3AG90_SPAPN|nr:mitochondrial elongation factor G like protein [Spathaspora passalidarum NRRL Y-27907]EGW35229.1 mitochondrial elongation factor G like protein [Spathaspora passalidarum NRRL Y-27907]
MSSVRIKTLTRAIRSCYTHVRTRNIGIIAHIDAGKTTTTERMIYYSGKTNRIGNVDEGDTVTDYLPSERARGITIQSAAITLPWNHHKINIIDTPGHADFTFEVIRSLRVLDGVVTILDAVAGVESQTEKVWKQASALKLPRIAYINKMDRPGAGFSRTAKEIISKLETRVVLCNIPYFETSKENDIVFKGVIDVIQKKLLQWNDTDSFGNEITVVDIESSKDTRPELYEMLSKSRESMVETLGEFDESIIDAFLEHDEDYLKIPSQLLDQVIRKATIANYLTPVLCGSSFRNIGVQPLMDAVTKYLPSPLETSIPDITCNTTTLAKGKNKNAKKDTEVQMFMDKEKGLTVKDNKNLTLALAFKVLTHKTHGPMCFFRVYSGRLSTNTNIINTRTGKKLLIRRLSIMNGEAPEEVKFINSGNIGVIIGYEKDFQTGDTIVASGPTKKNFTAIESNLKLMPIDIPPPLFNSAVEPNTFGDEAYMNQCIETLVREDPSLKVSFDEELGQTILSGMGELHLDIVRERLVKDMKAKVTMRDVAVSYKESFVGSQRTGEYKNEDGSLHVRVTMSPLEGKAQDSHYTEEDGAIIFEEDNNIIILTEDCCSETMKVAIEENRWKCETSFEDLEEVLINGCLTALQMGGPKLGFALQSTVIRVDLWNFPVSNVAANAGELLNASRLAVRRIVENNESEFTILEPIMTTKVYVDSSNLGEVSHDLTQRCQGVIVSMDDDVIDSNENANWASEEAENIYLPPDYTMTKSNTHLNKGNKKIIVAETPLREMIGYLSKLRSITQGKATFDMSFLDMRRAVGNRADAIVAQFRYN